MFKMSAKCCLRTVFKVFPVYVCPTRRTKSENRLKPLYPLGFESFSCLRLSHQEDKE